MHVVQNMLASATEADQASRPGASTSSLSSAERSRGHALPLLKATASLVCTNVHESFPSSSPTSPRLAGRQLEHRYCECVRGPRPSSCSTVVGLTAYGSFEFFTREYFMSGADVFLALSAMLRHCTCTPVKPWRTHVKPLCCGMLWLAAIL